MHMEKHLVHQPSLSTAFNYGLNQHLERSFVMKEIHSTMLYKTTAIPVVLSL
jgi:hypothetical protein